MLEKFNGFFKNGLPGILEKIKNLKKPLILISCFYIGLLLVLILTWYGAWWYISLKHGTPDLSALSNFIAICIGSSAIAAVTFIAGLFIDLDGDGIPDVVEKGSNVIRAAKDVASGDVSTVKDMITEPEEEPTDTGKKKLKKPLKEDSGIPKQ